MLLSVNNIFLALKMVDKNKYIPFSLRLTEAMKAAGYATTRSPNGICIKTLADITDASEQICRRYIRGDALPDYEKIVKIATHLQISPGWLLFGELNALRSIGNATLHIEQELLHYILEKSHALYKLDPSGSDDFPDFVLELINDVSAIDTHKENRKKVIDLAVASIYSFAEKKNKRLV